MAITLQHMGCVESEGQQPKGKTPSNKTFKEREGDAPSGDERYVEKT